MSSIKKLSVIIPFYNEEGNVEFVMREALDTLKTISCQFEILAFNDGSSDQTASILHRLSQENNAIAVITHARKAGQSVCLWEGLMRASGDAIITLDGDGQNDFRDIPRMLPLLEKVDAVFGQRLRRKDSYAKRAGSRVGFFFRKLMLGDTVRDTACALKIMRPRVIRHLLAVRNFYLFIPFMLTEAHIPFATIEVNHRPRTKGSSKYAFWRLYFIPYVADLFFMWCYKKKNLFRCGLFHR